MNYIGWISGRQLYIYYNIKPDYPLSLTFKLPKIFVFVAKKPRIDNTQNPFEVNLTIIGFKIRYDYK
jgi:hypothetical protein